MCAKRVCKRGWLVGAGAAYYYYYYCYYYYYYTTTTTILPLLYHYNTQVLVPLLPPGSGTATAILLF